MVGLCTGPTPPRYLSRLSIYLDFVPCYCCAGQSPPCYLQTLSICLFLAPFHLYFPNFLIYSGILFHSKSVLPNRWECNKSRTKESLPLKHPLSLLNSTLLQQVPAEAQVAPFLFFYLVHTRLLQVLLLCWSKPLFIVSVHIVNLSVQSFFPSASASACIPEAQVAPPILLPEQVGWGN